MVDKTTITLTPAEFAAWLLSAQPGSRTTYLIAQSAATDTTGIARAAMDAYVAGKVVLTQKRLTPIQECTIRNRGSDFEHYATRVQPRPAIVY